MTSQRRRIVVLRHGRTAWNEQRRFQGGSDVPLDEDGVAQAEAAATQVGPMAPSVMLTSDATRARQTAEPLQAVTGVEIVADPRLREADIGRWEGLTREEVARRFPEEYAAWRQGLDIRRGGGETYAEVAERAASAVEESLVRVAPGRTLVVVTHGGTAKAVIGRLLGLPPRSWRALSSLAHGRWSVLEEAAFGWRLDEHNVRPRRPRRTVD